MEKNMYKVLIVNYAQPESWCASCFTDNT
jgi:hypothetical protein